MKTYLEYSKTLLELVKAIEEENGLEQEKAVLIMHKLNSVEKISQFFEWVRSRMQNGKLQATEEEICSAAVQIAKVERNPEMYRERQKLLRTINSLDVRASVTLELIEPMKTMSEEEKEAFAKSLRLRLERGEIDF